MTGDAEMAISSSGQPPCDELSAALSFAERHAGGEENRRACSRRKRDMVPKHRPSAAIFPRAPQCALLRRTILPVVGTRPVLYCDECSRTEVLRAYGSNPSRRAIRTAGWFASSV
jgi:hypothetical protein